MTYERLVNHVPNCGQNVILEDCLECSYCGQHFHSNSGIVYHWYDKHAIVEHTIMQSTMKYAYPIEPCPEATSGNCWACTWCNQHDHYLVEIIEHWHAAHRVILRVINSYEAIKAQYAKKVWLRSQLQTRGKTGQERGRTDKTA